MSSISTRQAFDYSKMFQATPEERQAVIETSRSPADGSAALGFEGVISLVLAAAFFVLLVWLFLANKIGPKDPPAKDTSAVNGGSSSTPEQRIRNRSKPCTDAALDSHASRKGPESTAPRSRKAQGTAIGPLITTSQEMAKLFPGLLRGSVLQNQRGRVDLLNPTDRSEFASSLGRAIQYVMKQDDRKAGVKKLLDSTPSDATRFDAVAVPVCCSIVWLDTLAHAELAGDDSGAIGRLRAQFMHETLGTLERYYGESGIVELVDLLPNLQRVLLGPLADEFG